MRRILPPPFRLGLAAVLVLGAGGCATIGGGTELEQNEPVARSTEGLQASQQSPIIQLPPGFQVEKVVENLSYATSLTWDDRGRMYVVEAGGHFLEEPRSATILRVEDDSVARPSAWDPSRPCGLPWSASSGTMGRSTSRTGQRTARAPFPV